MGLDMYLFSVAKEKVPANKDIEVELDNLEHNQFAYWRKHHSLHHYMQALYESRGGKKEFNCITVRLFEKDIELIKAAIIDLTIKSSNRSNDIQHLDAAMEALRQGKAVFYDSWW